MAEQGFLKYIRGAISAALPAVATWLTAGSTGAIGPTLAALLSVLFGILGLVSVAVYRRYVGILSSGGKPKRTPERQDYDQLRESLTGNNIAARIYSRSLNRFLDGIDRFFGDADKPNQTLFRGFFGSRNPPRCGPFQLLSVVYCSPCSIQSQRSSLSGLFPATSVPLSLLCI
jgi:hypothetical protein